jgi:hypothetical protein
MTWEEKQEKDITITVNLSTCQLKFS